MRTGRPGQPPTFEEMISVEIDRRRLLGASALGVGAGAAGAGLGFLTGRQQPAATAQPQPDTSGLNGAQIEPFYGAHQSGVETIPQAHAMFVSLTCKDDTDVTRLIRVLKLLTDDAALMTQGQSPLADTEPELNERPARLTVTFGFGRGLVELAGSQHVPGWLGPLPAFGIDRLEDRLCRGDLLLQVCGDDPFTIAHAVRMLLKDARAFMDVAWSRSSFRRSYGSDPQGTTTRNLFGQVDGTANPGPGSEDFARLVWGKTLGQASPVFSARGEPPLDLAADYPEWLRGGTSLVLRDIDMNLATWDEADRPAREFSIGRDLKKGAPMTGTEEHDIPDLEATDDKGFTIISPASHVARSRNNAAPEQQIFRRVYNYHSVPDAADAATGPTGSAIVGKAGLMFASYQASVERQFLPIQKRLDEVDLLNQWTAPIGSTVWAIPPGAAEGEYIGQALFES